MGNQIHIVFLMTIFVVFVSRMGEIDPIALWKQMIPMQVCAMMATIMLSLLLARGEERKGIAII